MIEKEHQLRLQSRIIDGQRRMNKKNSEIFEECQRAIASTERQKRNIRLPYQKLFDRLKRLEQQWLYLQGKEKVYKVDVELDQILTYFRVAFVNLCTYLQMMFLNSTASLTSRSTLATLLHRIFLLPATIEQTKDCRRVYLKRNSKDKEMMTALEKVLPKLNQLNLNQTKNQRLEFFLR